MLHSARDARALEHQSRVRGSGTWRRTECEWCLLRGLGRDYRGNWCLNVDTGYYHCWRCEVRGYLPGYAPDTDAVVPEVDLGALGPPEDFLPLTGHHPSLKRARKYVLKRGISPTTAMRVGIGACFTGPFSNRVIVPVVGVDGATWMGWSARYMGKVPDKRVPKYRYPKGMPRSQIVFNQRAITRRTKVPLLCVEGVFDALPYYPHAVAFLGKPNPDQIDLLEDATRPVVICLDGDAWHEGFWLAEMLKFRGMTDVHALHLPPKRDPCNMGPAWVWGEVRKAREQISSALELPTGH